MNFTPFLDFRKFKLLKISSKRIFILLSIFIAVWMIWISQDFGISWDEFEHAHNGLFSLGHLLNLNDVNEIDNFIVNPITRFFSDPIYMLAGFVYGGFHGSLTDFVASQFRRGRDLYDYFLLGHALIALCGFFTIFFTGLFAQKFGNWKTGILAMGLLLASPRFLGNCMNNPKDIPFAATYVYFFYFLYKWLCNLPRPNWRTSAALIFGISAASWIRASGMLLIFYFFFLSTSYYFYRKKNQSSPLYYSDVIKKVLLISLGGYIGGILLWPSAHLDPLLPIKALTVATQFNVHQFEVLFEGTLFLAQSLPWHYLPKWLVISNPLFFISGLCFIFIFAPKISRNSHPFGLWMVIFGALFPLLFIIYRRSIVYMGWRHILFTYPFWIVLISLAFQAAWTMAIRARTRILLGIFFLIQTAEPIHWMLKHHPNEYVYFNNLVGGLKGAFTHYETDYWGNSLRKSAEWLASYHLQNKPNQPLLLHSDAHIMCSYPFLYEEFSKPGRPLSNSTVQKMKPTSFFIGYQPYVVPYLASFELATWDYALMLPHGWNSFAIQNNWPPQDLLYGVEIDGVFLSAVIKNPTKK